MGELEDLREFQAAFDNYKTLLDGIGERVGGEHWYAAATAEERQRVEGLRTDLNRRYGRVRAPIVRALGAVPTLGNAYTDAGELPQVALAAPADNPWIGDALDGTAQLIAMAIGHYEAHPIDSRADHPTHRSAVRSIGRFALTTSQQVVVAVLAAFVVALLAVWLEPFGIAPR